MGPQPRAVSFNAWITDPLPSFRAPPGTPGDPRILYCSEYWSECCRQTYNKKLISEIDFMADSKKILLTGGTGFIGTRLTRHLLSLGYHVTVLTRRPHDRPAQAGSLEYTDSLDSLDRSDNWYGAINLAGEPLNSSRWNDATRRHMVESRVKVTESLGRWMQSLQKPPAVLLSASATGWYGHWQDQILTEENSYRECFSHDLCAAWENAARIGVPESCRVCTLRLGIVLGTEGGPLPEMLLPAKLGASTMGSGRQWWSWVHVEDAIRLFAAALEDEQYEGPVNVTAPNPVTQREFSKVLARVLRRPALLPVPGCAMRLMLGEFADEILLKGQRVLPRKAEAAGYQFRFATLDVALESLLKPGAKTTTSRASGSKASVQ
jgi:uncharacterized protein (TIGR01777 family)